MVQLFEPIFAGIVVAAIGLVVSQLPVQTRRELLWRIVSFIALAGLVGFFYSTVAA